MCFADLQMVGIETVGFYEKMVGRTYSFAFANADGGAGEL